MKRRTAIILSIVLALSVLLAVPAAADDQQLTDQLQTGDTEVDAQIAESAGEVAYIVTVPEKIDFGNLVCPDTDEDSYTNQAFTVNCVQMTGVSAISVSVCNNGAAAGETGQIFYLTNQTDTSCTFQPSYDVYAGTTLIETTGAMPVNGFAYCVFTAEGESVSGSVRLNQRQLFPYKDDIASIAGSYTGTMVFTIAAA